MFESAADYHRLTSYDRHGMQGGHLDWANQPNVFKHYPGLEMTSLPREVDLPQERLFEIVRGASRSSSPSILDEASRVARVLLLTYTLTARSRYSGGEFYYRSVPSAGALYPCELYVAVTAVSGLNDGLYHYSAGEHALTLLRAGRLPSGMGLRPEPAPDGGPSLTFFLSVIFFRSAWKYRDRAFRYHLLDTGHLTENLALALRALRLDFRVDYDFDDQAVNEAMGLDASREVCLAVVRTWGEGAPCGGPPWSDLPADVGEASRVSPREVDYPAIREIHRLTSSVEEGAGGGSGAVEDLGVRPGPGVEIEPPQSWPEVMNFAEAVSRRRSKRNFVQEALPRGHLSAFLTLLLEDEMPFGDSVRIGFLAGDGVGLEPGFYLLDRLRKSVHLVSSGLLMSRMAHACLGQGWLANSALHFLFLTNMEGLESAWGPRGYRYAMLTSGRLGHRVYLGATAMRLGCCGIGAFYDYEAADLLGLNRASRVLYLVAAGPVKK